MQKSEIIKENRDFRRIYGKGRSFVSPALVIYVMKNKRKTTRIGITVGKKIGNAVQRNRAKRVIREAYRLQKKEKTMESGFDLVFVARKKAIFLKSYDIANIMEDILKSAGVIKK